MPSRPTGTVTLLMGPLNLGSAENEKRTLNVIARYLKNFYERKQIVLTSFIANILLVTILNVPRIRAIKLLWAYFKK